MNSTHLRLFAAAAVLFAATGVHAQLSLTSAVDLALRANPRVKIAQADVDKARAVLAETHDVYIPAVVGGSGLGYSYGFPVGNPSVFTATAQSLVFNFSQFDYIRSARAGLEAANLTLMDARQNVAADTALACITLLHDQQREAGVRQQAGFAQRLAGIVQDRYDAGRDNALDLNGARLSAAQFHLAILRAESDTADDRDHLARLVGLPAQSLTLAESSIPAIPSAESPLAANLALPPAVAAAYANARAKQEQAFGDARYLYRPQVAFAAEYNLFARFNNYDLYYRNFQYNNAAIGVQISVPVFDRGRVHKAQESAADAAHALHEADYARDQAAEGQVKLRHSTALLQASAEVAKLEQQRAQLQLDAIQASLTAPAANPGLQITPKDEQNARIAEREKYLSLVDASFQLRKAQLELLRQSGHLEEWLKTTAQTTTIDSPVNP